MTDYEYFTPFENIGQAVSVASPYVSSDIVASGKTGISVSCAVASTTGTLLIERKNSDGTYTSYQSWSVSSAMPITSDHVSLDGTFRMTFTPAGTGTIDLWVNHG